VLVELRPPPPILSITGTTPPLRYTTLTSMSSVESPSLSPSFRSKPPRPGALVCSTPANSCRPLLVGPRWTRSPPVHRTIDPVYGFLYTKINPKSNKLCETYTEAPMFCSNYNLALSFRFYLLSNPVNLQSSPCNFKTLYLFNRNSVLRDFCAKSFIATKPI
jgi:hypothetical protein